MIKGFRDSATQRVFEGDVAKELPREIQRRALMKLIMIDNSESLNDLRMPPSNHLEKLKGDRSGQYSIRVNGKYRICFTFSDGNADDVEIVDYH